jgi:FkbM family methyltransferase
MGYYGERGIDKLISRVFFPDKSYKGVFIEVGAADPTYLSISKHFRNIGWDIVSIEPNPYFAKRHREAGNTILEYACGEKDEDSVDFEVATPRIKNGKITNESFSSLKVKECYKQKYPEEFAQYSINKIKVKVRRLETIVKQQQIGGIDILSVDTEGWELEVIRSLNMSVNKPKLIVVENWLEDKGYNNCIIGYGYQFVCSLKPNEIYVRTDTFSKKKIMLARIYANILRGYNGK